MPGVPKSPPISSAATLTEIAKLQAELTKAQGKCDSIAARILELQNQKQLPEAKQVMEAFKRSGKSMQELMNFLEV